MCSYTASDSNGLFNWLAKTQTHWWSIFNKTEMPECPWYNVEEEIQRFMEMAMLQ